MNETYKYIKRDGVLINADSADYQNYLDQRARLQAAKIGSTNVLDKVSKLESELSEMKSLYRALSMKLQGL